jgi:Protein of unknown function (DUF2480)
MDFVNKVAESGLITINPENYLPQTSIKAFDIKDFLFMGMILKEKDYREALKNYDWSSFENTIAAVHCSADAIIPVWAYMLCTTYLQPIAQEVIMGSPDQVRENKILDAIAVDDFSIYTDRMMVVKGCGDDAVPESAYLSITQKLMPFAKSIMYGEPCSTVPIYKKKKVVV